jgi:VWFA-related protein
VRLGILIVAVACAGLDGGVAGQSRAGQDPRPTFRAATRLVQVSVVVHDRRGAAVAGLTADDFQLFDKGQAQPISIFSIESRGAALQEAPAHGETFFTNRVDAAPPGGVTVLLFDRVNTRDIDQARTREHVLRFIRQVDPADRLAFYVLESNVVRVLHDFTRDAASLVRAVNRAMGVTSGHLAASEERLLEVPEVGIPSIDAETARWIAETEQKVQGFYTINRAEAATAALDAIARRLAGVRGRKNLIWVSSGFPLEINDGWSRRTMTPEITRATRLLNDADIAVYPVDARGLQGAFASEPGARNAQFATLASTMPNIETMQTVAERTGGRAFYNTNDLGTAIARAADDARLTYVLGYYPTHGEWDGRFRDIKVRLRREGVEVRHRSGYLALPNPPPRSAAVRRNRMVDALSSPLDATGIGLSISAPGAGDGAAVTLNVVIDAHTIALEKEGGVWEGLVDLVIVQALPDGRLVNGADVTLTLRLTDAARARALAAGIGVARSLRLRPDAQQVRVGAFDVTTGATGTVRIDASKLAATGRSPR